MSDTKIEWADKSWNPIVGCSIVSPGCTNCYAMRMAARLEAMGTVMEFREELGHSINVGRSHYNGLTQPSKAGAIWTGKVALAPDHTLTAPLRWKKPRRVFVNSMGDLFHESVPDSWIDRVFAVMTLAPQHTFQVLTKRSKRMQEWSSLTGMMTGSDIAKRLAFASADIGLFNRVPPFVEWPLHNVHLGVSAEDQTRYDERADDLRATPAAVRFFSFEPLLGAIKAPWLADWAIVGGESGRDARPMHPDWARAVRDQCASSGVPFFFKQWGGWLPMDQTKSTDDFGVSYVVWGDGSGSYRDRAYRIGKHIAGRLLDGSEHSNFPA